MRGRTSRPGPNRPKAGACRRIGRALTRAQNTLEAAFNTWVNATTPGDADRELLELDLLRQWRDDLRRGVNLRKAH